MQITWSDFWAVCRDIILPESLTVIWSLLLYGFLGTLVTIGLLVLASKYKMFRRIPKYYNWAVKLYIPLVIIGTLYFALQIGLIRGVYKVMKHESELMSKGIYSQTIDRLFSSPAEKEAYLNDLKTLLVEYKYSSEVLIAHLKTEIISSDVDNGIVDKAKNKVAIFLIDRYKDEIFSAVIFGLLSAAGDKVGISEKLSWSESKDILEMLLKVDAAHIESAVQEKITELLGRLFYSQYSSLRMSSILMWLLIVPLLPIVEFLVYKKWLEPRYLAKQALNDANPASPKV